MRLLLLSLLFLIPNLSYATITIQSVGGVSYFEKNTTSNNFTLYGGMAGVCPGTLDNASTCNSCVDTNAGALIRACNMKSVYPTLQISITFVSDKAIANGRVKITTDEQLTTTEAVEYTLTNPYLTVSSGTAVTVSVPWSYLCSHDAGFGSGTACTPKTPAESSFDNPARKIYLWVDEDADSIIDEGEKKTLDVRLHYVKADDPSVTTQTFCTASNPASIGLCGFDLGIGDSKFFVQQLFGANTSGAGTAPPKSSTNAPDWYGLAFKAEPVDLSLISSAGGFQIRPYDATFGITDNTVSGLSNYVNYCLLMGNINKSQNIYKFNNQGFSTNDVCGQPSEVIGILSDKSCFISTAAFGSDMASQVQILREFRNQFLLTNSYGKAFVKAYYRYSPPIAHFIEHSEILKALTRTALYPFIALAWLAVNFGILPVAALVLFILSILHFILKKRRAVNA